MRKLVLALSTLFTSLALLVSGNAYINSLLGIRLSFQQVEPVMIGLVLFFFSAGFVVGASYSERVIERVGHIRAFSVFSAVLAVAALAYPLSDSLPFWSLLRFVSGISAAGLMVIVESWFSCTATNSNRGKLFAAYQVCMFLFTAGGQLLLQLAPPESFIPFSFAAMLLIASLVPLALTRMQSPSMDHVERLPAREIFRVAPLGLMTSVVNGVLMTGFYAMAPVYAAQSQLTVQEISLFMAVAIFSAMVFAWPVGYLCDRRERSRVMLMTAVVAGLASAGAAVAGELSFAILVTLTGLYMGFNAPMYAIAVAITNDRMETNQIVGASATLLLSYGIGGMFGPLFSAAMISLFGPKGFFIGNAAVLGALALYTMIRIRLVPPIPVEEQESFVATTPQMGSTFTELDPRNAEFDEENHPIEELFVESEDEEEEPPQAPSSGTL